MGIRNKLGVILMILAALLQPVFLIFMAYKKIPYRSLFGLLSLGIALLVFFFAFEQRRPQARELVVIAIMSVLSALGRALFVAVPSVKPTSAVVIITGMQFGPVPGFVTGAMSALVSNMLFGQGPFTLWQMYAWGMMGLFAGLFSEKGLFKHRAVLLIFGFVSGVLFGWFMNLQYLAGYVSDINRGSILLTYTASVSFDLAHGISNVVFLALLAPSWGRKLNRLKEKYGMMRGEDLCM